MKRLSLPLALFLAVIGMGTYAVYAASVNLSISITSPPSSAITLTPASPFTGSGTSFTAPGPVAAGVTVGTFTVAPVGWQGALALTGTNAGNFTLSGNNLVTAVQLPSGSSDAITVTATP